MLISINSEISLKGLRPNSSAKSRTTIGGFTCTTRKGASLASVVAASGVSVPVSASSGFRGVVAAGFGGVPAGAGGGVLGGRVAGGGVVFASAGAFGGSGEEMVTDGVDGLLGMGGLGRLIGTVCRFVRMDLMLVTLKLEDNTMFS